MRLMLVWVVIVTGAGLGAGCNSSQSGAQSAMVQHVNPNSPQYREGFVGSSEMSGVCHPNPPSACGSCLPRNGTYAIPRGAG